MFTTLAFLPRVIKKRFPGDRKFISIPYLNQIEEIGSYHCWDNVVHRRIAYSGSFFFHGYMKSSDILLWPWCDLPGATLTLFSSDPDAVLQCVCWVCSHLYQLFWSNSSYNTFFAVNSSYNSFQGKGAYYRKETCLPFVWGDNFCL